MGSHFSLSLRIWHPSMLSKEIAFRVGMNAAHAHDVGAQRRTPSGEELVGTYRETYCSFNIGKGEARSLDDAVSNFCLTNSDKFNDFDKIVKSGGRIELFIGLFVKENFGIELKPVVLEALSRAHIALAFDCYQNQ